ncbi:FAD/NAD(P)-binding domain-containing protein [Cucurbitaria berberidis CBS 394.84]|uniref:FAD/NAD(P)-binding domain-containing protein n=1 Tax=Cucurbitaria berberidis CBS 394.84 TaxID=1168544 RepID=A0A9P4L5T7_9PLEO|nr:FAD/NAD(P)-binding domain-containing protein [Cucurbitaria berberidis CBS 394.84]KAF1842662.1 FAD/NAD(P)-binding domain-containing protein [Cucurbitaria berberidis CBS 394.84]
MPRKDTLLILLFVLQAASTLAGRKVPESTVLTTDVAIVGGGASGTYAAIRLREDFNTSIVLIEPRPYLGGSVSTYLVPETNTTLEFGVQSYLRYGPALDFFARFGIALRPFASKRLTTVNIDVETGEQLKDYLSPNINATNEAFQRWLAIVSKYKTFLEPGYWNFPLSPDIPSDFLVPFEDFAKRHELEAAVPRILAISGVGYGGVRNPITLHLLQAFGASLTLDMLENQMFVPTGSNSLIYQRAHDFLGPDVLLSSTVKDVKRTSTAMTILVKQRDTEYIIKARRILYSAPPSLRNLSPFQPDEKEAAVFSTWAEDSEFVGIAKISCIPENYSINFIPSVAVPTNYLALKVRKDWPYSIRLDSTGPPGLGLFRIIVGANYTLSLDDVKNLVLEGTKRLEDAGTVTEECGVEFKSSSDHSRPQWKQTAEQLQSGLVQKLYGLQGYRGIWYVGYVWGAPYSSTIWAFTDTVLLKLLDDIKTDKSSSQKA